MNRAHVAVGFILLLGLGAGAFVSDAGATICQGCVEWEGNERFEFAKQASCCFEGPDGECSLYTDNWNATQVLMLSSDCWVAVVEEGYACRGTSMSCLDNDDGPGDGGDGGNDSCDVEWGTLCPAECMNCTYFFF